jgi:DNA-binding Lrp family transcriptional regulator
MAADLDVFDLRLLTALQREGRAPNAALAESVGLSPSQVSRRLARLEAEGVIATYAALLKPDAVGLSVLAFSSVSLERQAEAMDGFEAAVLRFPEILECYSVTGEQDFVFAHRGERPQGLCRLPLGSPAARARRTQRAQLHRVAYDQADDGAAFAGLAPCVMPGLVPGIHVLLLSKKRRGWPGQARP